jgi:predicted transcriptional regulator
MLTGRQIRCARAALRISVEKLSERTGVSSRTIKRIEAQDGVTNSTRANLLSIKSALEAAGIEFIGAPGDAPGIRIHTPDDAQ